MSNPADKTIWTIAPVPVKVRTLDGFKPGVRWAVYRNGIQQGGTLPREQDARNVARRLGRAEFPTF